MYTTINYNYGEYKSWVGNKYQDLVESSKIITGKPRIYLCNLNDVPVVEIVFHQNFILVLEIGTASVLEQMTMDEIFTMEDAMIINKIVDAYNPTEDDVINEGRTLKFKHRF